MNELGTFSSRRHATNTTSRRCHNDHCKFTEFQFSKLRNYTMADLEEAQQPPPPPKFWSATVFFFSIRFCIRHFRRLKNQAHIDPPLSVCYISYRVRRIIHSLMLCEHLIQFLLLVMSVSQLHVSIHDKWSSQSNRSVIENPKYLVKRKTLQTKLHVMFGTIVLHYCFGPSYNRLLTSPYFSFFLSWSDIK